MKWLNAMKDLGNNLVRMYKNTKSIVGAILCSIIGIWVYLGCLAGAFFGLFGVFITYAPMESFGFMKPDASISGDEPEKAQTSKIVFNAIGTIVFSPMLFACYGMLIAVLFMTFIMDVCAYCISWGALKFEVTKGILNNHGFINKD